MMFQAFVVAMLIPALFACAGELKVTVAAGDSDRADAPVYVDLKLAADQIKAPICVAAEGKIQPAQIEPLDSGQARVWWIIDNLPKDQSRTYEIKPGKSAQQTGGETFVWKDSSQGKVKSKDLCFGDRPVIRYMYTPFDGTDKDTIDITRKPYYHVFDPDGSRLITKGDGGKYPHHRGIFYGHNRVKIDGQDKTIDVWSSSDAHQLHTGFIREFVGPVLGGHVVTVDWKDSQGSTFATETRRIQAFRSPANEILVQFDTTITATDKPVDLKSSNNHHGGVQFRADQAVAENEKETRFLRPGKWATMPADQAINVEEHPDFKDLPWNAIQYKLGKRAYTVVDLCNPRNPRNAEFSERAYGRFGEYSTWRLSRDKALSLTYRFWVVATHDLKATQVDRKSADFVSPPKVVLD
jgi:hypothetical protein